MLKRIGNIALMIIRRRTLSGEYLEGSTEGSSQYSSKPFVMPFGGLPTKALQNKVLKQGGFGADARYKLFLTKKKSLWVYIPGGYKTIREDAGKSTGKATLSWSGRLMRNLGIIATAPLEVTLGFRNAEEEQKAQWHNTMGAGKSKVIRKFMGLTDKEVEEIEKIIGANVRSNVEKLLEKATLT